MPAPAAMDPRRAARRRAAWSLLGLGLALVALAIVHGPYPQDQAYHAFADDRGGLGVRNAADVLSNLPFLFVGIAGLVAVARSRRDPVPPRGWEQAGFALYAAGVALTAFGSAVYHLHPRDATLVWDRLPMSLAFAAFLALVLGERLGPDAGRRTLAPLCVAGLACVGQWALTLSTSVGGDLRAYAVMKVFVAGGVALLVVVVPEPRATRAPILWALLAFALATVFELADRIVFRATGGLVSGHTVKHLFAAGAAACLLAWFARRRRGAAL